MITFETIKETIEFVKEFVKTTEFVFDFATLLSIIGAALILIYTTRKENKKNLRENKKNLQNEKVVEIRGQLVEFKEHLDGLHKEINNKTPDPGSLLTEMAKFLRVEMLPVFAIFATKENIYELANMMHKTDKAIDVWKDFYQNKDKNKKARNTVIEAMRKYLKSMIDLDVQLTENLRNQVHNENANENKEIAKLYKKLKYTYREVEFK